MGFVSGIFYNDSFHYQDLVLRPELARLESLRAPLAALARRQISLPRQALEALELPLNPLLLLDLVRLR